MQRPPRTDKEARRAGNCDSGSVGDAAAERHGSTRQGDSSGQAAGRHGSASREAHRAWRGGVFGEQGAQGHILEGHVGHIAHVRLAGGCHRLGAHCSSKARQGGMCAVCVGGSQAAVAPAVCCPQPAGAPPAEPIVVSRTRAAEPRAPEERPLCGVGRLEGRRCALRQPAAAGCGCCRLHLCWSSCAASTAMRQQCATETRCRCKCCAAGGQRTRRLRPLVQIQTAGWRRQWIAGNVAVYRRASPTCGA